MYHDIDAFLSKLDVIADKTGELRRLLSYMERHHSVEINLNRLETDRDFLIEDIQALCREIANDKGNN